MNNNTLDKLKKNSNQKWLAKPKTVGVEVNKYEGNQGICGDERDSLYLNPRDSYRIIW